MPEALRSEGWDLVTMDERYGRFESQKISDVQWIEEATLGGEILLCKDLAIAENPLEAQIIYMSGARVFGLANASLPAAQMVSWYLGHEAAIVRMATQKPGPYVMAINPSYGIRRKKLAYPPH